MMVEVVVKSVYQWECEGVWGSVREECCVKRKEKEDKAK